MHREQNPDEVLVKISGNRDLVESIIEVLQNDYYSTLTSEIRESDKGGVFVYVKVLGERP